MGILKIEKILDASQDGKIIRGFLSLSIKNIKPPWMLEIAVDIQFRRTIVTIESAHVYTHIYIYIYLII